MVMKGGKFPVINFIPDSIDKKEQSKKCPMRNSTWHLLIIMPVLYQLSQVNI